MNIRAQLAVWAGLALSVAATLPIQAQQDGAPAAVITLDEALSRGRANEPAFAAARAASKTAALDRSIERSALLPSVIYHNSYLYTQPNGAKNQAGSTGTQSAPKFIANNAVHEYASLGVVNETIGVGQLTQVSRASAAAAIANAELEISRRDLTSTVVTLFYATATAQDKVQAEQRAADEATSFVNLTSQREAQREAAHADVLKAQLTEQQRERDLLDATLAAEKARLDLGVLLFPDPRSPYTVTVPSAKPQPTQLEVETAARTNNPELQSALATLHSANLDIQSARAAYLPDLALNFSYGIDAEQFAVNGPTGVRNLGYSASATLDIPVWDWFSTQHKVRQTQILRDAAKVSLSSSQRRLIAQLQEFYNEAALAEKQLDSLQSTVEMAKESLRLTKLRYTAGESTVLEVVDAQATLTTAELGLADGKTRYQIALANLQMLTGTI
jgi:outer membrane protein TolC